MAEFKPNNRPVLETFQLVKEFANCSLKLELMCMRHLRPAVLAANANYTHYLQLSIDNWLAETYGNVLKSAELVLVHQIHKRALLRTQISSLKGRA